MTIALIITFALLGITLLILEIFFLPGTTIAGIAGGLFILASIWVSFASFGNAVGWYTVAGIAIMITLSIFLFIRLGVMDKVSLKAEIDSKVEAKNKTVKEGDIGVAISRLAPIGNADINGFVVEVKSVMGFVDVGTGVKVVSADRQEVLVSPIAAD